MTVCIAEANYKFRSVWRSGGGKGRWRANRGDMYAITWHAAKNEIVCNYCIDQPVIGDINCQHRKWGWVGCPCRERPPPPCEIRTKTIHFLFDFFVRSPPLVLWWWQVDVFLFCRLVFVGVLFEDAPVLPPPPFCPWTGRRNDCLNYFRSIWQQAKCFFYYLFKGKVVSISRFFNGYLWLEYSYQW